MNIIYLNNNKSDDDVKCDASHTFKGLEKKSWK